MADSASYKDAVLAGSPLFYIPADPVDLAVDQSGNGRSGTGAGGVTVGSIAVGSAMGDALGATAFDGVDDRITTTYSNFSTGAVYTYEWWQNRTNTTNEHVPYASTVNTGITFRFAAGASTLDFFPDRTGAGFSIATGVPTGQWVYIMVVFDDPNNRVTALVGTSSGGTPGLTTTVTNSVTGVFNVTPGNFQFGARSGATTPFLGGLGHFAAYSGDASALALDHYGWGLSTAASRTPSKGLPSATTFPHSGFLPAGGFDPSF